MIFAYSTAFGRDSVFYENEIVMCGSPRGTESKGSGLGMHLMKEVRHVVRTVMAQKEGQKIAVVAVTWHISASNKIVEIEEGP